jgi:2-polyprenyl-6-methoxyphenol hydroxylase-like FAD-dependent oxidoreductase
VIPRYRVDVAVIGAGPAGSATTIALRRRGLSVALVEARARRSFRIGETVPAAIRQPLVELDAWEAFRRDEHLAAGAMCSA